MFERIVQVGGAAWPPYKRRRRSYLHINKQTNKAPFGDVGEAFPLSREEGKRSNCNYEAGEGIIIFDLTGLETSSYCERPGIGSEG
jgi:hypothetical protein